MDAIMNGWFSEMSNDFPGQAFSLKVKKVLYEGQSDFQKILIFERYVSQILIFLLITYQ